MLDFVEHNDKKIYVKDGILNLNLREIEDLNEVKGLENLFDLEELHLQHNKLTSLSNLNNLTNLKLLQLNDNQIENLNGLKNLTSLYELNLSNNKLHNINGLDLPKNLKKLDLFNNLISNIGGFKGLTNLKEINLRKNRITEISGLSDVASLEILSLGQNRIQTLDGLENLKNIKKLHLGINLITSMKGIEELYNLKFIDLRDNKIEKIEGLKKLIHLEELKIIRNNIPQPFIEQFYSNGKKYVKYCQGKYVIYKGVFHFVEDDHRPNNYKNVLTLSGFGIQSISQLKNLENLQLLEVLNLVGNEIERLEGLDSLKSIKLLLLSHNNIKEIQNLEKLTNLENLSLNNNEISGIKGLNKLSNLKELDLSHNQIKKFENLNGLSKLTHLNLSQNKISEIAQIKRLDNLKYLNLSENKVDNLITLSKILNLETLNLSSNQIKSIKSLRSLKNLRNLDLSLNHISEIPELNLSNLKILRLNNNELDNMNSLCQFTYLKYLNLNDNHIEEINCIDKMKDTLNQFFIDNNNLNLSNEQLECLKIPVKHGSLDNNSRRFILYAILRNLFQEEHFEEFNLEDLINNSPILQRLKNMNEYSKVRNIIKFFRSDCEIRVGINKSPISILTPNRFAYEIEEEILKHLIPGGRFPLDDIVSRFHIDSKKALERLLQIIKEEELTKIPFIFTEVEISRSPTDLIYDKTNISNLRVLLLGSNCKGIKEVLISKEITEIRNIVKNSFIQLIDVPHIKRDEIYEKISEFKPQIVHFSGHGTNNEGPLFDGDEFLINTPPPLINQLIDDLKKSNEYVKLVIFNVCESLNVAKKTSGIIDFAIGIEGKADDDCATSFSKGFYKILLNRESINNAFDHGLTKYSYKYAERRTVVGNNRPYEFFPKIPSDDGNFSVVFGKILNNKVVMSEVTQELFTQEQKNTILKSEEFQKRIHSNYPFEKIKVRYMDSNFYSYMNNKQWNKAANQILFKLKKEIHHLHEFMQKITSINTFLNFKNHLKTFLDSDDLKIKKYIISPEKLIIKWQKESEQFLNDMKSKLKEQIYNIDYLAGNFITTFSDDGIYIFLDSKYLSENEQIKSYFINLNKYCNENVHIERDERESEQILETSYKLIEKIDSEQIRRTIKSISQTLKNLMIIKEEFEKFQVGCRDPNN